VLPLSEEIADIDPGEDRSDSDGAFSRDRPSVRQDERLPQSVVTDPDSIVVTVALDNDGGERQ